MDITLRRLIPTDAEAYIALRQEMLDAAPHAFLASPESDISSDVGRVREMLDAKPGGGTFGAFDALDARLLGAVGLFRERHPKAAHRIGIWGMYVAPAARRSGIGRRLMEAALREARTVEEARQVALSVSSQAPAARRLYESLGFTTWGTEPAAMCVDGVFLDEVHMSRILASEGAR